MDFVDFAMNKAETVLDRRYKHAALLIRNNEIISWGVNDIYQHAETSAITKYLQRVLCGRKKAKTKVENTQMFE